MSVRSRPMAVEDHVCLRLIGRRLRFEEVGRAEAASREVRPGIDSVSSGEEETEVRVWEGMRRLRVSEVMCDVSSSQSVGGEVREVVSLACAVADASWRWACSMRPRSRRVGRAQRADR